MIIVIGGGPAGYFGAIRAQETAPECPVVLLEKSGQVLRKVAVSGGGRCNVTHACFEPRELIARFPRGSRELRGPFHTFGPAETVAWFAARGVSLKTESDGRMFPLTDSSRTIVDCLQNAARQAGVDVRTRTPVAALAMAPEGGLTVTGADGKTLRARAVLLATGGQTSGGGTGGYEMAAALGHTVAAPVPSLFTFKTSDPLLDGLAGVAVARARVQILEAGKLVETGPVLITHWGLSGPAVLRLSAWGARMLAERKYRYRVSVNWTGDLRPEQIDEQLQTATRTRGRQLVHAGACFEVPRRLWRALVRGAQITDSTRWADLGRGPRRALAHRLGDCVFTVDGRAVNKEEFVTCGGVALPEVDFRTMASRVCPGLYLAGEVLDIDGVTGGFNFQSCWTTGWLAGSALAATGRPDHSP